MDNSTFFQPNNQKAFSAIFISLIIIFVYHFLCYFLNQSLHNCFIAAMSISFTLFIPGIAIVLTLFKRKFKLISFICLSFSMGYGLNILEYFLTILIGINNIFFIIGIALIASISIIIRKIKHLEFEEKNNSEKYWLIIFMILFLTVFFAYSAYYIKPNKVCQSVSYHIDSTFWIENAAALSHDYPADNFRMSGSKLYYHYLGSCWLAFQKFVTNIDLFSLGITFYALIKSILLFGAVYELATSWITKTQQQIMFSLVLLFTTGIEKISIITYVSHLIIMPLNTDISIAFACYLLAFLKQIYDDENDLNTINIVPVIVSMLLCTGHKAPIAISLLVFTASISIYWLYKKQYKKGVCIGLSVLFSFILIMTICMGYFISNQGYTNNAGFTLSFGYGLSQIANYSLNKSKLIFCIAFIPLFAAWIISIHPIAVIGSIINFVSKVKKHSLTIIETSLLATITISLLMSFFIKHAGHSQMYYAFGAIITLNLLSFYKIESISIYSKSLIKNTIILIIVFSNIIFFSINKNSFRNSIIWHIYKSAKQAIVNSPAVNNPNGYQIKDMSAIDFLRNNTPQKSIILTNRCDFITKEVKMNILLGTFAERTNYLERIDPILNFQANFIEETKIRANRIKDIFNNSKEALEKAKKDGVNYIVQTKWLSPDFSPDLSLCKKIFDSETIRIWEIIK